MQKLCTYLLDSRVTFEALDMWDYLNVLDETYITNCSQSEYQRLYRKSLNEQDDF